MPARRLTFTTKNILSAWKAVGIIPFNPRHVLGVVKKKETNVSPSGSSAIRAAPPIIRTPRGVSRATRTAISLVTRTTPSSQKLKSLLVGLSEGFQQTIADKTVAEEAHCQYRQLMGKEQRGKTSDRRKLTEATVITSEMVIELREQRERVDAVKAARKAKKEQNLPRPPQIRRKRREPTSLPPSDSLPTSPITTTHPLVDEVDDLWEEMEALDVGGDGIRELGRGGLKIQSVCEENADYKLPDQLRSIGACI